MCVLGVSCKTTETMYVTFSACMQTQAHTRRVYINTELSELTTDRGAAMSAAFFFFLKS